jgi:hypothetical protein
MREKLLFLAVLIKEGFAIFLSVGYRKNSLRLLKNT